MMTGDRAEEPVRLPGMISMDLEGDQERLRSLRMTVPLQVCRNLSPQECFSPSVFPPQIFVDTGEPGRRAKVSPGTKGSHGRSESAEARQRKRTRDWLEGKLGGRSGARVRSAR